MVKLNSDVGILHILANGYVETGLSLLASRNSEYWQLETRQLVVTRIVYIFHFVRHVLRWLLVMFADLVPKLVMNGGTVHHDLDTLVFPSS